MHSFIYKQNNGIEYDSKHFNILVNKKPKLVKAQSDKEFIEIAGRDGTLTVSKGGYKDVALTYICTIIKDYNCFGCNNKDDIEEISIVVNTWLDGTGTLIMSHLPRYEFKVKDVLFDGIDVDGITGEFEVTFICEPFKYLPTEIISLTEGENYITNPSNLQCQPILTLYGTGTLYVDINGNKISISNVEDYVVIDGILYECYSGKKNYNNNMIGDYPVLKSGNNIITLDSNAVLEVQWRYL